jgi:SAM-dependent methyltransferase
MIANLGSTTYGLLESFYMHDLLRRLPDGAKVLDLGCGNGSFDASDAHAVVIGIDLERGSSPPPNFVQGDASALPFPDQAFDAIISNHSLEHVPKLDECLSEIARVLKPSGWLYVAVPDSTTITDRLYRWLADGGGHVNPFPSAAELSRKIEAKTSFPHRATQTLCTSLSFLNRRNRRTKAPRRLLLVGGGTHVSLLISTYAFRIADRIFKTRASVYGWAFYFGEASDDVATRTNVCVGCGSGAPSSSLLEANRVFRRLLPFYKCTACGTLNIFTRDEHYSHLAPPRV